MSISKDGDRPRFYSERKLVAAQQGNPIHEAVGNRTRMRICRELHDRAWVMSKGNVLRLEQQMHEDLNRVFLRDWSHRFNSLAGDGADLRLDDFLQLIEICILVLVEYRKDPYADINCINSLLADDMSVFRVVDTRSANPRFQVHRIDNEHLHTVLSDRTFELTQLADFASAQNDYADAWKHYSKGDTDDAIANAHKAVESAAKVIIKRLDPTNDCEQKQMNQLVPDLVRLDVLPSRMQNVVTGLNHIFANSGSLRNQAGTAHGSLDPTSPEASTALLALRLSGTLIAFLAERWTQMKQ